MQKLVNITIPIYKESISHEESLSLLQAISVLSRYQLTLVCPNSLNLFNYFSLYENFQVERFDDSFFESIDGYNRLLMSREFYKRFLNYKYILIYQLDAFVFRDELEYWCSLDFDYIGAPWFNSTKIPLHEQVLYGVGNGGFSLRNVRRHYNSLHYYCIHFLLKSLYEARTQYLTLNKNRIHRIAHFLGAYFSRIFFIPTKKLKITILNEDQYWSLVVPKLNPKFKLAPLEYGIKFAFEENPHLLYEMNNKRLPFGCHAWYRYETHFWTKFIQSNK